MSRITADNPVPWRVMPAQRIGLIDADGILFAAALEAQIKCDGETLQVLDDEQVLARCHERIEAQADLLGDCPQVFICLSARTSFRKRFFPEYKANRKASARPLALDYLRGRLVEGALPYSVFLIEGLEADDACGIMSTKFQTLGYEVVIISPDKDLLTIPGMTLTPSGLFSEVSEERANREHLYQTLVGDSADNYKGCPGVGPVKADALLDFVEGFSPEDQWEFVVSAFEAAGLTEQDALTQARVARILRAEDWDFDKKEPILWRS